MRYLTEGGLIAVLVCKNCKMLFVLRPKKISAIEAALKLLSKMANNRV